MAYIGRSPSLGNYEAIDDISSGFNGSTQNFTLQSDGVNLSVSTAEQMIISLGGVIQNPGVDFTLPAADTIRFTTPPSSSLIPFFGVVLGQSLDVGVPTTGSISNSKVASGYSLNTDWLEVNSPTTVSNGDRIMADTSGGAFTITLPNMTLITSGIIQFADTGGSWGTYNLTINPTAANIEGDSSLVCNVDNAIVTLIYNGTEWKVF